MAEVQLFGSPPSTYTRTALLALEEKGVDYELVPLAFGSDELRAVNPFGNIPALAHGDFTIYETIAVCRYIDEAFEGPALQPTDAKDRARMAQWISAINSYYDQDMIRHLVIERFAPRMKNRDADEARIADAMPRIEHQFDVLEAWFRENDYLVGENVSIADFFLVPILAYVQMTPVGEKLYNASPAIMRWWDVMASRPSFATVLSPPE